MKSSYAFALLAFASFLVLGCTNPNPPVDQEAQYLQAARNFITADETYAFDGIQGTLVHTKTMVFRCPGCYEYTFVFNSSHAGYGNRSGQVLAQVVTEHTAIITFTSGNISGGVLDGQWDMMSESYLEKPDAAEGEFCGGIAAIQCESGLVCKLAGQYPDAGGTCISSQGYFEVVYMRNSGFTLNRWTRYLTVTNDGGLHMYRTDMNGSRELNLTKEEFDNFKAMVVAANVSDFADEYVCTECATDQPSSSITFNIGGDTKDIYIYMPNSMPPALETIISYMLGFDRRFGGGEGDFCGGIAAFQCASGFVCKLDGNYPDAGGKCIDPARATNYSVQDFTDYIKPNMTFAQVRAHFGEPFEDIGSGIHIYTYLANDLSIIKVGAADENELISYLVVMHPDGSEEAVFGSYACQDECGNGACQEYVCMAISCPCSETHESCPQDCP